VKLPLLILAEQQTAGRGRGANRWWTGPGSLAFSLLVDLAPWGIGRSQSPLVSLAAAVAVAETVAPRLRGREVGIHWPNDVYAAGRKLSGILVEVPRKRLHILGIGLNVNDRLADAPPELRGTATTLRELTGRPHGATKLLMDLLNKLQRALRQLASEPGQVAARADRLCLQRGRTLKVSTPWQSVSGVCLGIASDGAMLLQGPAGPQRLYTGVVEQ